jgi:hypothetical protein
MQLGRVLGLVSVGALYGSVALGQQAPDAKELEQSVRELREQFEERQEAYERQLDALTRQLEALQAQSVVTVTSNSPPSVQPAGTAAGAPGIETVESSGSH